MLFKVFTVLCAISLLGGFAIAQSQNDQLVKLLAGMVTNSANTNKNTNDQAMQLLVNSLTEAMKNQNQNEQAMQALVKMLAGGTDAASQLMQLLTAMQSSSTNNAKTTDAQLVQLLTAMMNNNNNNNAKTTDSQLMQLLTAMMNTNNNAKSTDAQLLQLLTAMMNTNNNNNAKSTDSQLMQLLTAMMNNNNNNNAKTTDAQLMQLLTAMMNSNNNNNAKTSDTQLLQLLTAMMNANQPKTDDAQMMQLLTAMVTMMGGTKDATKTAENQMMQLMMLAMLGSMSEMNKDKDMNKSLKESFDALAKMLPKNEQNNKMLEQLKTLLKMDDSVKPAQCMASQNMMTPVKNEVTAWVNMLKTTNMKDMFGSDADYDRFVEMLKYVEGSQAGWLTALMRFVKGNSWVMDVVNRMVDMLQRDPTMQAELKKFIESNKDVLEFTRQAVDWMKTQNFTDASPLIQKVVPLFQRMNLKSAEMDKAWFDNYNSWVDCTFGKDGELQTVMKTVGMLSKVDMLAPLLKGMMASMKPAAP